MTRQTKQTTILHSTMVSIDFFQFCLHHFFILFHLLHNYVDKFSPMYFLKRNMKMCVPKVSPLSFPIPCFAWVFENLLAFQHDCHYFLRIIKKFIK